MRANQIWEEVEQKLGLSLLQRCGFIFITRDDAGTSHHGKPGFLAATRNAALKNGISLELLDAKEMAYRFPQFTGLNGDEEVYFEPGGGYLPAEDCIAAQLELAKRHGAVIRTGLQVLDVAAQGAGVLPRARSPPEALSWRQVRGCRRWRARRPDSR